MIDNSETVSKSNIVNNETEHEIYYVQPENEVSFYVEKNSDNYEITSECPFTNIVNEIDDDEITHVVPEIEVSYAEKENLGNNFQTVLDTNIANKFEHVDVEEIEDETRRKSRMGKSVSRQKKRIDDFFSCITKTNTEKCDVVQNIMQTFPSNAVVSKYQEVISDGFIQYLLVLRKEKRNKEFSKAFTVAF